MLMEYKITKAMYGMFNGKQRIYTAPFVATRLAIFLVCLCLPVSALSDDTFHTEKQKPSPGLTPIRLFQKFISPADGDRCPMHPSCSSYAAQAVKKEGIIKGWILACDRLLRCGRDETRLGKSIRVNGVRLTHDPLSANTFWWDNR